MTPQINFVHQSEHKVAAGRGRQGKWWMIDELKGCMWRVVCERWCVTMLRVEKLCVCVERLNRRKSSFFLEVFLGISNYNAGGSSVMVSLLPTKTLTIDGDTRLGRSGVPALLWSPVVQGLLFVSIYLILQLLLVNGIRLSPEPVNRFIYFLENLYVCRNLNFGRFIFLFRSTHEHFSPTFWTGHGCILETSGKGCILFSDFLHGYSDGYIFEDSFRSVFSLVLYQWDSVPDGFNVLILSNLVWFPWWLRHGAMDPFEGTPSWETLHRLDFWIDTFNLVIHLSKVEQLAFSSRLTADRSWLNYWPQYWAITFSFLPLRWQLQNLLFPTLPGRQTAVKLSTWQGISGHAFRCGTTFLLVILVRSTSCAPNLWRFAQPLHAPWG